jgi:UTP--glucose-1-phosphate uridylyltransferase
MSNIVKKVIIPAGGFGTRFLPATKAQPKEMLSIVDKPVIQYIVEEAANSGIKEIILVTGKGKRAIEDHFDHAMELESFLESRGKSELARSIRQISSLATFYYVRQKEPKGIGDAILQARSLVGDEPVAIMSGDDIIDTGSGDPALKQLMRVYEKYKKPVVAVVRMPKEEVYKYGVIVGEEVEPRVWRVSGMVEKPTVEKAPSNLVIVVKYIITPQIFEYLAKEEPVNEEIYINLACDKYIKNGGEFYAYEVEGIWYDCGMKLGLLKAIVNFGLKHQEVGKEFKEYLKNLDTK